MKALIIEDEPRARAHMQKLLSDNFPAVEVVGAIGSVKDSLEWLRTHPAPEVIFMDVELSDGNSFEIFSQTEIPCPVIMTTAYDQYAVHAFEVNAVDYLLKPIEVADLKRAIQRVASGEAVKPAGEAMRSMMAQVRKEKFLIRLNDRIVPVRTSDIAYFYSEAKNSYIVTLSGSSYVTDDSLDALADSVDPEAFFRISRSCIISEGVIDSVSRLMGGRLRISLRHGIPSLTDLTVSRARVDGFLEWLEK
ncbi:MAG: response regulator transcription factor [Bacteroidales bacterium]|jgi:DNA-binding LytR/AlgR family response regulator|nr:response regulator transcription factor [Bacteroidales bacterium]